MIRPAVYHLSSPSSALLCQGPPGAHTCHATVCVCAAEEGDGHVEDKRGMPAPANTGVLS